MLIERRKLILGGLSLLAAPAIVRATNLDFGLLRGYNMDPKVLAFWDTGLDGNWPGEWRVSRIPYAKFVHPANATYDLKRISETVTDGFAESDRRMSQTLPLSRQLEAMQRVLDRRVACPREEILIQHPKAPSTG